MVKVTDAITVSLGYDTPDGFLRGIDVLAADAELRRQVIAENAKTGALLFSNNAQQIFAEGLVAVLVRNLLNEAPPKLRAGETVHHLPFEDDSPIDLIPKGDALTVVNLEKEISVAMPLQAALEALVAEAAHYSTFLRLVAEK